MVDFRLKTARMDFSKYTENHGMDWSGRKDLEYNMIPPSNSINTFHVSNYGTRLALPFHERGTHGVQSKVVMLHSLILDFVYAHRAG